MRWSWPSLARLDQDAGAGRRVDAAVAAQLRHARQHLVGAFGPFHRQHVIVGDDHGLADVERARGIEQRKAARDIGAVLLARRTARRAGRAASASSGAMSFGAEQPKAVLLEQPADAGLQMIVAAAEHLHELRHQPDRPEVRPDLPKRRPHHRTDEGHVAASLFARRSAGSGRTGRSRTSDADRLRHVAGRPIRAARTARRAGRAARQHRPAQTAGCRRRK